MGKTKTLAKKLKALGHPLRLKIIRLLAQEKEEMYLSEIAGRIGISRALTKVHLRKLEKAGLVKSKVVLVEGEARALRYYKLVDFTINLSPESLAEIGD